MDTFNLKKFLTENKLTRNARLVRENDEGDMVFSWFDDEVGRMRDSFEMEEWSERQRAIGEQVLENIENILNQGY